MWPDRVSNPGPLTYESGALPIALRGPAEFSAYLRSDFFTICDLNSLMTFPKSTEDFTTKRNVKIGD